MPAGYGRTFNMFATHGVWFAVVSMSQPGTEAVVPVVSQSGLFGVVDLRLHG